MNTIVMIAIQTMATTFTSGAARPSVHGVSSRGRRLRRCSRMGIPYAR